MSDAAGAGRAAARRALAVLQDGLDARTAAYLNACVRCDLCAESCHVHLADGESASTPASKVAVLGRLHRRYRTLLGRVAPGLVGARDLDEAALADLLDAAFGRCTACGRCALSCSVGLDPAAVVRFARRMLAAAGRVPAGIMTNATNTATTGNNMSIDAVDVIDTVQWLEEDLRDTLGDATARMPIDRAGARVWYLVNPSEVKFFPLSLSAAAMVFHAAGEDWTLSSTDFDVTNYGYFTGDPALGRAIAERVVRRAAELGVREIVMAECGHGYRALRWEAPEWLGRVPDVPVRSFVEVVGDYLRAGRITLDPSRNAEPVTLHDPCNLVRNGGVIEEQRYVLSRAVASLVEMTPNRLENYCCGGGGGILAAGEYKARRLQSGGIKAGQIRATGARVVASPCHNCITQLKEIGQHYALGVEVRTIGEIVADALVLPAGPG
jgi:Fe-S oxidoreductase